MSSEACPSIYLMLLPKILDPKQRPKVVVQNQIVQLADQLKEQNLLADSFDRLDQAESLQDVTGVLIKHEGSVIVVALEGLDSNGATTFIPYRDFSLDSENSEQQAADFATKLANVLGVPLQSFGFPGEGGGDGDLDALGASGQDEVDVNTVTSSVVAKTILQQLGSNKFLAMTGAKNLLLGKNYIQMDLPATLTKDRGNRITITLDPDDTYTLKFAKTSMRGGNFKESMIAKKSGVMVDNLRDVFTGMTGLHVALASLAGVDEGKEVGASEVLASDESSKVPFEQTFKVKSSVKVTLTSITKSNQPSSIGPVTLKSGSIFKVFKNAGISAKSSAYLGRYIKTARGRFAVPLLVIQDDIVGRFAISMAEFSTLLDASRKV